MTEAERGLLVDFGLLLDDFHALPAGIQSAISGPVERMGIGMRRFAEERTRGVLKLADLSEVNRYCFVVAGLVSIAFGVVLASRPDAGAISLAVLYGIFSLALGITQIVLGVQARRAAVPGADRLAAA